MYDVHPAASDASSVPSPAGPVAPAATPIPIVARPRGGVSARAALAGCAAAVVVTLTAQHLGAGHGGSGLLGAATGAGIAVPAAVARRARRSRGRRTDGIPARSGGPDGLPVPRANGGVDAGSAVEVARADGQLVDGLTPRPGGDVYFDLGEELDAEQLALAGARLLMDGTTVHFVLPQTGAPALRTRTRRIGGHSVVSLHPVRDGAVSRFVRRSLDVIGAVVLLLLLSPVFVVLALVVALTMGTPVIYAQTRLGRFGRRFRLYKFRSMVRGADELLRRSPQVYKRYLAFNFKLPPDEDPRLTPLGRFMRRASLDELPQLWNVLRGDMSLVGPRAIVPDEIAEYRGYGGMLLRVKPGLTGIWQVSGRSAVGYPDRARMDLDYLQGRSVAGDLYILLRTLPAVLRQRGAV